MTSSPKVIKSARPSPQTRDIPTIEREAEEEQPADDSPLSLESLADLPSPEDNPFRDHRERQPDESAETEEPASVPPPLVLSSEELEQLCAQVREEGRQTGYANGKAEATPFVALLQNTVDELNAAWERFTVEIPPQLLKLAVEIAEKIIRCEVQTDSAVVERIATEALQHAVGKRQILIRVHPDDLETLQSVEPELRAALDSVREFEIVPDRRGGERRMARGGCVVETESGIIDARLEAQLAEVQNRLVGED
jgi:flagellar biosynthesis/type III secretory pathway protein FliH